MIPERGCPTLVAFCATGWVFRLPIKIFNLYFDRAIKYARCASTLLTTLSANPRFHIARPHPAQQDSQRLDPTHILNGFIWALWGVYDYALATKESAAQELFARGIPTLLHNLDRYDLGFWSLYEQSGTRLPMVASKFYHRLHIVQLRVMYRLTGEELFACVADRWENYLQSSANRARALAYKAVFKLYYY